MGWLNGALNVTGAVSSGVGGILSIANALFPKQIIIRDIENDKEIYIDSTQSISTQTGITASEHPTEDAKILTQNISKNPRTISLNCILSNITMMSNLKTLASAGKYASNLLLPEAGNITNLLLNDEDSITDRLDFLYDVMENGRFVEIKGLPGVKILDYLIMSVSDTKDVATGSKAKSVVIEIREAFIVQEQFGQNSSLFSKELTTQTGTIDTLPPNFKKLETGSIA